MKLSVLPNTVRVPSTQNMINLNVLTDLVYSLIN